MTTPDTYLSQVDPSHIWTICVRAAPPGHRDDHMTVIAGEQYGARAYLPTRSAARAAHAALTRVGYQAVPATGARHHLDLTIYGWSAQGLEARLAAMRDVLSKLTGQPGSTAATALDHLAQLPVTALPGQAGQEQLVRQAGEQLRDWIFATSGIHAPCDPLTRPADASCALRLTATWRAEHAIDDLASHHLRITSHAVALYPGLRQTRTHDSARESAVRQAATAAHLTRHHTHGTTPVLHSGVTGPGSPPWAAAEIAARIRTATREFPATPTADTPATRQPSLPQASPRGRTLPVGRPGQHRRNR
jgi:hypothetical protein